MVKYTTYVNPVTGNDSDTGDTVPFKTLTKALSIATAGIVLMRQVQPVLPRNLIENNTHGGLVVNGRARPDNGNSQDPAGNILRNNGKADIQNSTSVSLVSLGN